ncbi:MAG: hypothetical protein IT347_04720 [Candidatus Eisenbacteria bacterium]|nr:hypothetical protein [Candidatus Eisenbacteria bacterium]
MRAYLPCRAVFGCLLVVCAALSPSPTSGQNLDFADPPCGLAGDSAYAANGGPYTWNPFHYYRVPLALSRRANRDFEFLWSDTYKSRLHTPLDSLSGTPAMTDIDRLGLVVCEERGRNPFGLPSTDLQLAYDFLAQRQVLDSLGVPIERRNTYNSDQNAPIGIRVAQPSYPDAERTHIDAYIFGRQFSGYGQWATYAGDGWESGGRIHNYGLSPSGYWWATAEDSATVNDPGFYHENSLQIPGPFPSQVGNTGPGRWTRPGGTANSQLIHESLHAINYDTGQGLNYLHMFASGDGAFGPGTHAIMWDGTDGTGQRARPGVYLYRMTAPGFRDQRRMVLLGR